MGIAGIIAEYNPFHLGHKFHLEYTKKTTNSHAIIAVVSGNFVQRGEPSLVNKWHKTMMALNNGIDLVIELPLVYSIASAESFAFGAVSLLDSLGVTDHLCFGCEIDNMPLLWRISMVLVEEPLEYKNSLHSLLKLGISFASAREKALEGYFKLKGEYFNTEELKQILTSSNSILGIEYLKSLIKLKSNIIPHIIKRVGSSYNSSNLSHISSATAIRKALLQDNKDIQNLKEYLPSSTYNLLSSLPKESLIFSHYMLPYLKYKAVHKEIVGIPGASEGLENKIHSNILSCQDYCEIIEKSKSKRYTTTRVQRILCNYFIGSEELANLSYMQKEPCPYARVLGFNAVGRQLLSDIKRKSNIPLITKIPKEQDDFLKLDILGTNSYSILDKNLRYNEDYYRSPLIVE
ncbi:Predicted nucleotidyltransferase [Hathewaya proteolytica DSM 3090]|uniref:tRNA(Met) cytidine acetate ligase n=1 Tax=Hathewaya proteolytica DSM 3090 TaxID=1121331 RepID=A0A1M6J979_9CLOT|nr:nucleotidyltransferase [Hathewaya proteolytica]SHJ43243.1 Predicted nucleotidyltransferase [Hathewaya proteolytica DSM 3090]